MNIMVFDVPAEYGGALAVLDEFYNRVKQNPNININWYFVVSKPEYQETNNIKILRFPWVKKSWLHRLYFENFIAYKLVGKYKVDRAFSLQNMIIKKSNIPQILYVHQSLPFCEFKFSFRKNMKFWLYQNMIGKEICKSIQKAEHVIVQTNWMKKACIAKTGVNSCQVTVVQPQVDFVGNIKKIPTSERNKTFFYPAAFMEYKNHKIIIEACVLLAQKGIRDYKVIFTLDSQENKKIKTLFEKVQAMQLTIEFVGRKTKEQVYEMYGKSILLFPSYIETFGLPMLECKVCNGVVVASDCAFSHEILDEYENAYFFDPFNAEQLANLMQKFINHEFDNQHRNCQEKGMNHIKHNSWDEVINIIVDSSRAKEECI